MANGNLADRIFHKLLNKYGEKAHPAEMPEPHRTVLLVYYVDGLIGNGGFQYLFEGDLPGDPKASSIGVLLAAYPLIYLRTPAGDRPWALGAWLVFSLIVGCLVVLLPVLRCPNCQRTTAYFDNYSELTKRSTGGRRRYVTCKNCHSVIDRLNGTVVCRLTAAQIRNLDRYSIGRFLVLAGVLLNGVSIFVGIIASLSVFEGMANNDRALVAILVCVGLFVIGLVLIMIGWGMRRPHHRF